MNIDMQVKILIVVGVVLAITAAFFLGAGSAR